MCNEKSLEKITHDSSKKKPKITTNQSIETAHNDEIEILKQALAEREKSLKELHTVVKELKEDAQKKDIIIQNLNETLGSVFF